MEPWRSPESLARRRAHNAAVRRSPEGKAKRKAYAEVYYLHNKDEMNRKARVHYAANRERVLARQRKVDAARRMPRAPKPPRKSAALRQKEYRQRHPERVKAAMKEYHRKHPEKIRAWKRVHHYRGMKDPEFVVVKRLRTRLHDEIRFRSRRIIKFTSALNLVGCSRQELVKHIESQFKPGMNWENRTLWHIDHIRPVASFDMLDLEQQKACFHFSNLQPLWRSENCSKGAKIIAFKAA